MASHIHDDHGTDHDWDFPPLYPPLPTELPDEFLNHPESNEAFNSWVESTCGPTDDKQPVEQYDGTLGVTTAFVDTHESPVGNLHWNDNLDDEYDDAGNVGGERWCTGTLVAEDLFLTAGHCFDQSAGGWTLPANDGATITPHEIATSMHVDFNYQVDPSGNLRQTTSYQVDELVEYRVNGLDYAVVRLQGTPGTRWGTADLAAQDAQNGDTLCIIQHPGGSPKRIEAGHATHIHGSSAPDPAYFGYDDIDTLGGSSGSGVLRESDGRLVGVHTNGGCTGRRSGHNHGVKIGDILDASSVLHSGRIKLPINEGKQPQMDGKFKFADDNTLKFSDDGGGTLKHVDDRKTAGLDKPPGTDGGGGKPPWGDGGGGGTVKHVDDRKSAGLDKPPGTDSGGKPPGADGGFGGGGMGERMGGYNQPPARPFVLQTPHHSMAWSHGGQQPQGGESDHDRLVAHYESLLARVEELLQQRYAELSSLEQQYQQLVAEYQSLTGDTHGGQR